MSCHMWTIIFFHDCSDTVKFSTRAVFFWFLMQSHGWINNIHPWSTQTASCVGWSTGSVSYVAAFGYRHFKVIGVEQCCVYCTSWLLVGLKLLNITASLCLSVHKIENEKEMPRLTMFQCEFLLHKKNSIVLYGTYSPHIFIDHKNTK